MTELFEDVPDYYEHEKQAAQQVAGMLQRRYAGETNMGSNDIQQRFIREAKGIYAENGLVAEVELEPDVSDDPADNNIYWIPKIVVTGRVDKLREFDHDRQKHEVRTGVFDGVAGVIDPNTGQMKDEPKKKTIT